MQYLFADAMKVPSYETCGFASLWHGACGFCHLVWKCLEVLSFGTHWNKHKKDMNNF
jgi:hypothetical protein